MPGAHTNHNFEFGLIPKVSTTVTWSTNMAAPATTQGKEFALAMLADRRQKNAGVEPPDNSKFPAFSPMYFPCLSCGAIISVPESYTWKPDLCSECQALKQMGWLE